MTSRTPSIVRVETPETGEYLVFHSPGKKTPYIQSLPECKPIELQRDDVVADIGAFVGEYAIRCARAPVEKVRAYEPTPVSYEVLRLNLKDKPNAEAIHAAVVQGNRRHVRLYISNGNGTRNKIQKTHGRPSITVPAVPYHEAVEGASVVKIDTEGAEWSFPIVENLNPPLRALIIEFHPCSSQHRALARHIMEGIESAGFILVYPGGHRAFWERFSKHGKQWGAHAAWVREA